MKWPGDVPGHKTRFISGQRHGVFEADAEYGAFGQVDVLALRRGDHAAATDQHSGNRALHAAQDATKNGAHAGAGTDSFGLTLKAVAFKSLRHVRANVASTAVHRQARELNSQAALAVGPAGAVDRRHVAGDPRTRRHHDIVAAVEVDHGRGFNGVFHLRGIGGEGRHQPHVEFATRGYGS